MPTDEQSDIKGMKPVGYTDETELRAVKDGNGLMWPGPMPASSEPFGEVALYTADQVKELADRLEKAEAEREALIIARDMMGRMRDAARNDALEEAAQRCIKRGEDNPDSYGQYSNAAFSIRLLKTGLAANKEVDHDE